MKQYPLGSLFWAYISVILSINCQTFSNEVQGVEKASICKDQSVLNNYFKLRSHYIDIILDSRVMDPITCHQLIDLNAKSIVESFQCLEVEVFLIALEIHYHVRHVLHKWCPHSMLYRLNAINSNDSCKLFPDRKRQHFRVTSFLERLSKLNCSEHEKTAMIHQALFISSEARSHRLPLFSKSSPNFMNNPNRITSQLKDLTFEFGCLSTNEISLLDCTKNITNRHDNDPCCKAQQIKGCFKAHLWLCLNQIDIGIKLDPRYYPSFVNCSNQHCPKLDILDILSVKRILVALVVILVMIEVILITGYVYMKRHERYIGRKARAKRYSRANSFFIKSNGNL